MFSIENFYYILYSQLLEPLGVQDNMFTKFGSTSMKDFRYGVHLKNSARYGKPVIVQNACYYFDQEPMYVSSVGDLKELSTLKKFKALANSEHSALKTAVCKECEYQDWYYFFHGFAALDWFRDSQYFEQDINWSRPYISLNRLHVADRSYRLNLVARLVKEDLIKLGYVSLHLGHAEHGSWRHELADSNSKLSLDAKGLIGQYINEALILDTDSSTGDISAALGHQEFELWKSGLWHLVTETVFYYNKLHLTEKIFKPIVAQRPFMLAAAPGNLRYLKSYGFKTFDRWIDESYDDIQDNDLRLQAIVNQTKKLCSMSNSDLQQMHQDMQPVLRFNFNHLWTDFKEQIVNELVDNFERSVRLWNNGRVDGRELPLHKVDLQKVKKILVQ